MRRSARTTITTVILATAMIGCSSARDSAPSASQDEPLVVFLVRHGEKADLTEDAELSAAGRERAAALARTLRSAEIEYVHSSDFIRTRETAAPTADPGRETAWNRGATSCGGPQHKHAADGRTAWR
jgi:hypothetical protein